MKTHKVPGDCAMCHHKTCPIRAQCWRHPASGAVPGRPEWQTWTHAEPTIDGETVTCQMFVPIKNNKGDTQ